MIQRLITTFHALSTLPVDEPPTAGRQKLFGDCADAVRLELDCPQQSLTMSQRAALTELSDLLDHTVADPAYAVLAAQRAYGALGLADRPLRDRSS